MDAFSSKTYRAIFADIKTWIIANQDIITDFNEGGVLNSLCEAVSLEIEQIYLRCRIGFIQYLSNLPFYAFGFSELPGALASGSVIFSRNIATTDPVTIPIGTIVSSPSGLLFTSTSEGTILANQTDSGSVSISANEIGTRYNLPASSVTIITTPVNGVDSVNNSSALSGGLDGESTEDFKNRFKDYILGLGRGNVYGIITGAKTVTNVRSVSTIEHFPPLSGLYNVSVYIDDGAGNAPAELIAEVENVLIGDGTETYPGYKPAGINLQVVPPTKVTVNLDITVTDSGDYDRTDLEVAIEAAVSSYINNLKLGEDVIISTIIKTIMEVAGVYDVVLNSPGANITISASQIARLGTITTGYYVP